MSTKKLEFASDSGMFGTTISLRSKDRSFDHVIVKSMPTNPLEKMDQTVDGGYLFRSPSIGEDAWESTMKVLARMGGPFNLSAVLDSESKSVTAHLRIANKDDAVTFAWANVDIWQKWSDAQEEALKEEISKAKKTKIKVGKDGRITIKGTVTTLGD